MVVNPERPYFVERMEPLEVNEGDALLLRCRIEGTPKISVTWFKAGGKLRESNLCSLDFTSGVATLKLGKTTKFDRGEYICRAESAVGSASASCHVVVKGDCFCPSLPGAACCSSPLTSSQSTAHILLAPPLPPSCRGSDGRPLGS